MSAPAAAASSEEVEAIAQPGQDLLKSHEALRLATEGIRDQLSAEGEGGRQWRACQG